MPDVGPQFESSGEKKDRPEKAELGSPADEVPESVKEVKGQEEVENEELPKHSTVSVSIDRGHYKKGTLWRSIEVPMEETKVEFPQHLKEVTHGVSGYIRKKVNWDDLLEEYPKDFEFNKPRIKQILREARSSQDANFNGAGVIEEDMLRLIDSMTNNNFPSDTYNHVTGLLGGRDKELSEQHKEESLFIQKVLDPKTILNLSGKQSNEISFHGPYIDLLFSKVGSNEVIDEVHLADGITNSMKEKIKKLKEDPSTYISANRGLSVSKGKVWGKPGSTRGQSAMTRPMYGFGTKNKAFTAYMRKVKRIFERESIAKAVKKFEDTRLTNSNIEEIENSVDIGFDRPDVLHRSIQDMLEEKEIKNFDTFEVPEFNHPRIPIFNGHPDIPDLRWCFADYASIPTEESLNVLEFISEDVDEEEAETRTDSEKFE